MFVKNTRFLCLKILALAVLLGLGSAANAAFQLRITDPVDPSSPLTITDNGPGDSNNALGAITFVGSFGGFTLNVHTGLSKPAIGSATDPRMDLNILTSGGAAGETIQIEASDVGFTKPPPFSLIASAGGTNSSTSTSFQTFFDNSNTNFGTGGGSSPLRSSSANSYSFEDLLNVTGSQPYSLTVRFRVTSQGGGTASADGQLTPTPEPASGL